MPWFALILLLLMTSCGSSSHESANTLRVATIADPETLDPRKVRNLISASAVHLLFEGLMRYTPQGVLEPALALSYELSDDRLTYTFHLRNASWSGGEPITAHDFVYSWKSTLDPSFPAPNAFHLFAIKNARAAKLQQANLEDIGVVALDDKTLVVTLDAPTPYFLELTAFHALFPIHRRVELSNPNWAEDPLAFESSGPFTLECWRHQNELCLKKNPHYWDASHVHLSGVHFVTLDEQTAVKLFEVGSLDWVGSPLSTIPADALSSLDTLHQPVAGTAWLRLNTQIPPLDDVRVRRALALAIDRQEIVDHLLQGQQKPAMGIVPPTSRHASAPFFSDHDADAAKRLFAEHKPSLDSPIILTYSASERHHRLAQTLQEQWRRVLGFNVQLQALEAKVFYDQLSREQYSMANGGWFADFNDPMAFLAVFESRSNGTNNTGWEDPRYQKLLQQSSNEPDSGRRQRLLREAEQLLMDAMPVIPLFFYTNSYLKNPRVEGATINELGILHLRNAKIQPE